ncbi:MAG: hypothetical protein KAI73_04155 [Rhodospirillaceae bacterium]|nr:hypothetical protein [Rhodospirillaceae bacterium]
MHEKPYDQPSEDITWDTGLANIADPGPAKKVLGWIVNEILPSNFANWLQHFVGKIVTHNQANAIRTFSDIAEAIASLLPDSIFRYAPDALHTWGGLVTKATANTVGTSRLCTDGARVYYLESGSVYAVTQRENVGGADVEWSHADATHSTDRDTVYDIDTDGAVVAYVGEDESAVNIGIGWVFNARTGAALFGPQAFTSVPRAVVADSLSTARRVFFVEDGSTQIQEWREGSGFANWVNTSETIKDICTDGQNIYALVTGTFDAINDISLFSYHKITKAFTLLDNFTETSPAYGSTPGRICCDGEHVYGIIDGTGTKAGKVCKWARSGGPAEWCYDLPNAASGVDGIFISVDERYVYANATEAVGGALYILDKRDGAAMLTETTWINAHQPAPDGEKAWLNSTPSVITAISAKEVPRSPGLWLRTGDGYNNATTELGGAKYEATRQPGRRLALPLTHTGR